MESLDGRTGIFPPDCKRQALRSQQFSEICRETGMAGNGFLREAGGYSAGADQKGVCEAFEGGEAPAKGTADIRKTGKHRTRANIPGEK